MATKKTNTKKDGKIVETGWHVPKDYKGNPVRTSPEQKKKAAEFLKKYDANKKK